MPVVTRNGRRRARGPRANQANQEELGQNAGGPPPGQPPNLDQVLTAINNLIGVVQQRLPPVIPQPVQQGAEGQGISIRVRSRSPPPRLAEGQGEASVHRVQPPPVLERAPVRVPRDIGDEIRELLRLQPPIFTGTTVGTHAEAWLQSLQRCFRLRTYGSNLKARLAIHQLRDDASNWWKQEETLGGVDVETLTWESFVDHFRARYLSEHFRQRKLEEFHDLQ